MNDLVEGLKAGDQGAYNRLVRDYGDRLFRFCLRLVGPSDAQDVVQEVFVRVHRCIRNYQPTGRFESWLFTIANNLALDALRRRRPDPRDSFELVADGGPVDEISHRELQDALLQEVERLPTEQKQVFLLREEAGMSFREIAAMLGCPLNTALGRMHYAMEHLRKQLRAFL